MDTFLSIIHFSVSKKKSVNRFSANSISDSCVIINNRHISVSSCATLTSNIPLTGSSKIFFFYPSGRIDTVAMTLTNFVLPIV
jgi:hypothetical protein